MPFYELILLWVLLWYEFENLKKVFTNRGDSSYVPVDACITEYCIVKTITKTVLLFAIMATTLIGCQSYCFGQEPYIDIPEKNVQQCIEFLKDQNKNKIEKLMAINALGKMGAEAKDAIPIMIEIIQDSTFFSQGCYALMKMGPDVIPALIKTVQDNEANNKVRISATRALGMVYPHRMLKQNTKETREIVALLEKVITDPHEDEMVRYSAGCALGLKQAYAEPITG